MKIDITKQEYRALIDIMEIANWVMTSYSAWSDAETKKYAELAQKLYAQAEEMDCSDIIKYDERRSGHYPIPEYQEDGDYRSFIDAFEEDSFWDEISHKLAFRDLIQQEGEEALENMDFMERGTKMAEFLSWYEEEFMNNGLANVRVVQERSNKLN